MSTMVSDIFDHVHISIFCVFWVFPSSGHLLVDSILLLVIFQQGNLRVLVGCWVVDALLFWSCFCKWVCQFIFFNTLMGCSVYYSVLFCTSGLMSMRFSWIAHWSYDGFLCFETWLVRPFQERHAIACTRAHICAIVFRQVINCTHK